MAKVRIGIATQFELENELVGIGTDNPTNTLQALGNIRSSDAKAIGVSTLREYQGFVDTKLSLEGVGGEEKGTTSGEIIIEGTVKVSTGITFTSGPENLTVTDNFTLPAISDDKPSVGTTRFNEDFGSLEFYTGVDWRAVNSYVDMGNRNRGVIALGYQGGGNTPVMDYITFSTEGNAINFGELSVSRNHPSSHISDGTRGLYAGGQNPNSDVIDYITIAATGNAIDFGNLTTATQGIGGCSSSTRGLMGSGYTPSQVNTITYVEIQTIGNSIDFGDLRNSNFGVGTMGSPTRGLYAGGNNSPAETDVVKYASKGDAVRFGTLSAGRYYLQGGSNSVRGCWGGGYSPGPSQTAEITTVILASNGNSEQFGELTVARKELGAVASQTRVAWFGGKSSSTPGYNTIDYISITSGGSAQDFGDLSLIANLCAGVSDCHGGLGGF